MAIVTSASVPRLRGTFMALNTSVRCGDLASLVDGQPISRDAQVW